MAIQPFELDLRGKGLEEVVSLLTGAGFRVTASKTDMWDNRDIFRRARPPGWVGPPAHVVWIPSDEASCLTVIIFNGKKITLNGSMDLHLLDRPLDASEGPGQDWCAVHTRHVMEGL